MRKGAWTPDGVVAAFLAGEPLKALAKRVHGSPSTLRRVLIEQLGEDRYLEIRDRNDPKCCTASEEEVLAAFHTGTAFKDIAAKLGMSPNTLRDRWVSAFGKEAFDERSYKLHSAAGTKAGKLRKGKRYVSDEVLAARAKASETARGIDRRCPVCNFGCVGYQALTNHMSRFGDEAHNSALIEVRKREEDRRWEGLEEEKDYVVCAICGFKGEALNNHIKLHQLTASTYLKVHGALRSSVLRDNRAKILSEALSRNLYSRSDLMKYMDDDGKVVVSSVQADTGHTSGTILGYCRKFGLPTRNTLSWQKTVLDKAAAFLCEDYEWEWSDDRIRNPNTGKPYLYDGFFPSTNLIIEAHGQQHFQFSETWHGTVEEFEQRRAVDHHKEQRALECGYNFKVVRHTDPIESSEFWTKLLGSNDSELWVNKSEEAKHQTIETIFHVVRRHGWPEPSPSPQIKAELTRLKQVEPFVEDGVIKPYSIAGGYAAGTFFPNRYHAKRKNGLNAWDMWHDDKSLRKAIRLQLDSGHPTTPERILKAVVMFSRTPSVFRPVVAKYIYQTYCPSGGVVWDPCSGYGGRLMAAIATSVRYVGSDIEPATVVGNQLLAKALDYDNCCIEEVDATKFDPGVVDLVFTSPPYFNLENYGSAFNKTLESYVSVNDWLDRFLQSLIQRAFDSLRVGGYLLLNLPSKPVDGIRLDIAALSLTSKIGFAHTATLYMPVRGLGSMKREPILVWQKS